jgi:hypothetical protein
MKKSKKQDRLRAAYAECCDGYRKCVADLKQAVAQRDALQKDYDCAAGFGISALIERDAQRARADALQLRLDALDGKTTIDVGALQAERDQARAELVTEKAGHAVTARTLVEASAEVDALHTALAKLRDELRAEADAVPLYFNAAAERTQIGRNAADRLTAILAGNAPAGVATHPPTFPHVGPGCDVCGFGSVENCEAFDPTKPCPDCGATYPQVAPAVAGVTCAGAIPAPPTAWGTAWTGDAPAVVEAAPVSDTATPPSLAGRFRRGAERLRHTAESFPNNRAGRHERAMCIARAETREHCAALLDDIGVVDARAVEALADRWERAATALSSCDLGEAMAQGPDAVHQHGRAYAMHCAALEARALVPKAAPTPGAGEGGR